MTVYRCDRCNKIFESMINFTAFKISWSDSFDAQQRGSDLDICYECCFSFKMFLKGNQTDAITVSPKPNNP